jgi:hypothetical protein
MRNYRCKRLVMALAQHQPLTGLIHQPDRGRQNCSNVYVERQLDIGACVSISTPGQPTENAFEDVYNAKRLLSSLYYVPPVLDDTLTATFQRWYPGMETSEFPQEPALAGS